MSRRGFRFAFRALSVLALALVVAYGVSRYGSMGSCPTWFALVQIPVTCWFMNSVLATIYDIRFRKDSRSDRT
jgi:hypothetical protein